MVDIITNSPDESFASPIASTNLGSKWRTIRGILDEMDSHEFSDLAIRRVLNLAGLPPAAMEDPDFPISIQQDWQMLHAILSGLPKTPHPATRIFQRAPGFDITVMGIIGLAMKHAPDFSAAVCITTDYPQLTWGRCRLLIDQDSSHTRLRYNLRREDLGNWNDVAFNLLHSHALTSDLVGAIRIIDGLSNDMLKPSAIRFVFDRPDDWESVESSLPCPVEFGAGATCLEYAGRIADLPMPGYNRRAYRTFLNAVQRAASLLMPDSSLSEQIQRWLWACPTPPGREEMARLLSMSERSLNRQLQNEGTSYRLLVQQLQCERAQNLLTDQSLSVSDIAWRLGYAEPQAFSLAFRRWTGQAPSSWRRNSAGK